jgi:UDP:flavonoid glycosyltransferase YjiC (YdhE family)
MRLLFSATPAYGHVLPLSALAEAAVEAGHDVALLTSPGFRSEAVAELAPEVAFLAAGAMPAKFSEEAARRTGADVFQPTPEVIGEIFGGARVDLGGDASLEQARQWAPDVIVAESFDAIGPLIAARLSIPWHQVGIGAAVPAVIVNEIERAAASRYRAAGLVPVPAASYIDPCPSALQDPDWSSRVPVRPIQPRAHRRREPVAFERPAFSDPAKPTVLVTLGTIFSDPDVLSATVGSVIHNDVNVIATLGSSMRNPAPDEEDTTVIHDSRNDRVRYVPFVPLDELLTDTDLVVGSGGAGTVLGALTRGVPMVLWPQGADQPINAARAAASGASITVGSVDEVSGAVALALGAESYRRRARDAAAEIARRPAPAEIVKEIAAGW